MDTSPHASQSTFPLSQESVPLSAFSSRASSPLTELSVIDDDARFVTSSEQNHLAMTEPREAILVTSSPPPDAPLPAPLTSEAPRARVASNRSSRASSRSDGSRSRPQSRVRSTVLYGHEDVLAQAGPSHQPIIQHPTPIFTHAPEVHLPPLSTLQSRISSSPRSESRRSPDSRGSSGEHFVVDHLIRDEVEQEEGEDRQEGPSSPPLKRRRLSPDAIEEAAKILHSESTTMKAAATSLSSPPLLNTFTCPICFGPPTNATMTPCGHICCGNCLFTAVKSALRRIAAEDIARCPVCRAQIPNWDGKGGGVIGLEIQMMGPGKKTKR